MMNASDSSSSSCLPVASFAQQAKVMLRLNLFALVNYRCGVCVCERERERGSARKYSTHVADGLILDGLWQTLSDQLSMYNPALNEGVDWQSNRY